MSADQHGPVGVPVPRIDSLKELPPDGPELTDEEKSWPVGVPQARSDSFEVVGSDPPDSPG